MEKPAAAQYPIHELLKNRWSPRAFSAHPIESEHLFSLFEAARWSPSGSNLQPWYFVVTSKADSEAHNRFVEILTGSNGRWAQAAPVLILAAARLERQNNQPNFYALYDVGQAVANLTIQASALGLAVHQMGGFDREKARQLFNLPDGYEAVVAAAIGYPGSVDDLPEDLRQRELQPRERKALGEFVFQSRWNEPLQVGLEATSV